MQTSLNATVVEATVVEVKVPSFEEVLDANLRGQHTAYSIVSAVRAPEGELRRYTVQRRFSEWRKLHATLALSPTFPEPRRLRRETQSIKEQRRKALQAYLHAAIQHCAGRPAEALRAFLGLRDDEPRSELPPAQSPEEMPPAVVAPTAVAPLQAATEGAPPYCVVARVDALAMVVPNNLSRNTMACSILT